MLARYANGSHPVHRLRDEVERVFGGLLGEAGQLANWAVPRGFPAMNIWQDGEKLYVEAEVPGLGMEDLELTVEGDELTLKGQRRRVEDKEIAYHRQERGVGTFTRSLTLPVDVDTDKVEATLKDGVLTVVLPKAEAAKPRKIAVKGG